MSALFEVKPVDQAFYEERLQSFLPDQIIDIHTHVWLDRFRAKQTHAPVRSVTWPSRVAKDNSVEDLIETYRLMFPGKKVVPLMFSSLFPDDDMDAANSYVQECSARYGFPALIFANPRWSGLKLERLIREGGFYGCKVYLNFAEPYIPEKEIRIYDFLPHHHLEVLNQHGWMVMLHIPRDGRLRDPVNLAQMLEIQSRYPKIRLIIAHVGRAYCDQDVGQAFDVLKEADTMLFDFSANTNAVVFEQLIRAVGPRRILFGSDLPILRMRTRRIEENGRYVNLVPRGLYGDVSGDKNLREVDCEAADSLTFFMYEEIDAFRRAAERVGLSREDIQDVFCNNSVRLLQDLNPAFSLPG